MVWELLSRYIDIYSGRGLPIRALQHQGRELDTNGIHCTTSTDGIMMLELTQHRGAVQEGLEKL